MSFSGDVKDCKLADQTDRMLVKDKTIVIYPHTGVRTAREMWPTGLSFLLLIWAETARKKLEVKGALCLAVAHEQTVDLGRPRQVHTATSFWWYSLPPSGEKVTFHQSHQLSYRKRTLPGFAVFSGLLKLLKVKMLPFPLLTCYSTCVMLTWETIQDAMCWLYCQAPSLQLNMRLMDTLHLDRENST